MAIALTKTASPAVQYLNFSSATVTFTDAAIGSAAADRIVVVVIGHGYSQVSGVTIGGNAATEVIRSRTSETGAGAAIYQLAVASGTTATIVVTHAPNTVDLCGIHVFSLTGADATPNATSILAFGYNPDPQTLGATLALPTGGVGLIGAIINLATSPTLTWTGATTEYSTENTSGNGLVVVSASSTTASTWNPTATGANYSGTAMAAVTWNPAAGAAGKPWYAYAQQ